MTVDKLLSDALRAAQESPEVPDLALMAKRDLRAMAAQGAKLRPWLQSVLDDDSIPEHAVIEVTK